MIESRNTGIETCRLAERRAPSGESVEWGTLGDAGVKTVMRERSSLTVTAARARDQTWTTSVDMRVEHGG